MCKEIQKRNDEAYIMDSGNLWTKIQIIFDGRNEEEKSNKIHKSKRNRKNLQETVIHRGLKSKGSKII